uniref:Uncharacterized protein n=1 Tax=Anguilla anguilla TaxID=7936 RepID=A0A0E9RMB6_ANGAN
MKPKEKWLRRKALAVLENKSLH